LTHSIPPEIFALAKSYTDARVKANETYYSIATHRFRAGDFKSVLFEEKMNMMWLVDFKGILGELLYRDKCDRSGVSYWCSAFVKKVGKNDPDLIISDQKIDIKGVEGDLKVNAKSLEKSDVDQIIFIKFLSPAEYEEHTYTREEIATWKVKNKGDRNEFYYKKV
jgi:hypothetical protein